MKGIIIAIIVIILLAIGWYVLFFDELNPVMEKKMDQEQTDKTSSGDLSEILSPENQPQVPGKVIVLDTNKGIIKIEMNREAAPLTTNNFVYLVSEGFYDGLIFHRIVPGFVIQGGDPLGTGMGGPGYTVPAEIGLKHTRGAIATARTGDEINPNRNSSGSQFYIALEDLQQLDGQYTVFGQVIEGMDVVDEIAGVQIGPDSKPIQDVIIKKAYIEETNN